MDPNNQEDKYPVDHEKAAETDKHAGERDDDRNSDEDVASDYERRDRFVESAENSELFKSKTLNDLKPFYNGTTLDERMFEIRKSIYYIRQHWDDYDDFLEALKKLLLQNGEYDFEDPTANEHAQNVLNTKRDWLTASQAKAAELGYEAIKLYTSNEGHARIYSVSNDVFRKEDSVATVETIRSVVFLVELINIDLYNYCLKCPEQSNFEGIVYRGLCLSKSDAEAFITLRREPIGKRNFGVPLGLFSASTRKSVARKFIRKRLKAQKEDETPLEAMIIKTNVVGLKQEYLQFYNSVFPTSMLSTICAVDIHKLSRHPNEKEVLLRGPFLLVLDLYEDSHGILGKPCHVLETLMVNTNRDHISTSFLGERDAEARDLIGLMRTVKRSEFGFEYCTLRGLTGEAEEYKTMFDKSSQKLDAIMTLDATQKRL